MTVHALAKLLLDAAGALSPNRMARSPAGRVPDAAIGYHVAGPAPLEWTAPQRRFCCCWGTRLLQRHVCRIC